MSSTPPTFYRAEIYEDTPYAWWPMDDQPLEGGVLPTTLLNAALGNTNELSIIPAPSGVSAQDTYGFNGTDITAKIASNGFFGVVGGVTPPAGSVATYEVGRERGVDVRRPGVRRLLVQRGREPRSRRPRGRRPGSRRGSSGTGGTNGWFLSGNDAAFPGLSGGVTVKGWFNAGAVRQRQRATTTSSRSATSSDTSLCGQPFSPITIARWPPPPRPSASSSWTPAAT